MIMGVYYTKLLDLFNADLKRERPHLAKKEMVMFHQAMVPVYHSQRLPIKGQNDHTRMTICMQSCWIDSTPIWSERGRIWPRKVAVPPDHASMHKYVVTRAKLQKLHYGKFTHPPYSPGSPPATIWWWEICVEWGSHRWNTDLFWRLQEISFFRRASKIRRIV